MIKQIQLISVFCVVSILFVGCVTAEGFEREKNSFLKHVIPTFKVETKARGKVAGNVYSHCMKSCIAHSNNMCVKYAKNTAKECDQFLGK